MENETQITQLLTTLLENVESIQGKLESIDRRISRIEMQIENTVIPRIQLIAESHINLSRKLDSALEQKLEREMLKMRVEVLESDMKRYKIQA